MEMMTPEDSRAIASDMHEKPVTDLPFEDRAKIQQMCLSGKIRTYSQYLTQRKKLLKARGIDCHNLHDS